MVTPTNSTMPSVFLLLLYTGTSAALISAPSLHEIKKTFYLPSTPYEEGLRHIHSMEHILKIHNGSYFQIHSTTKPVAYGKYTIVSATCSVQNTMQEIRMFSDQQDVSHVVCIKSGIPQVTLQLKVTQQIKGHLLTINASTYLRAPLWTNLILTPLFIAIFEGTLINQQPIIPEDENLTKYRKMVFANAKPLDKV